MTNNYDPKTGEPIVKKDRSYSSKVLTSIAVFVAAVIIILIAFMSLVQSGALLGKKGKVLRAIENTFEPNQFLSDLDASSIIETNKYTVSFDAEMGGTIINGKYQNDKNKKALSGEINFLGFEFLFDSILDKSELSVDVPMLDTLFVYNYKEDNDEYMEDFLCEMELEEMDTVLESLYDFDYSEISDKLYKVMEKEFLDLEFEKVQKEKFEVSGKDRNCIGYSTTIRRNNLLNVIEGWNDVWEDYYDVQLIDDYLMSDIDYRYEINVTFYTYKNQLAAVIYEVDSDIEEETVIEFRGGDYPTQNVVIETKYYDEIYNTVEIKGSIKDSVETIEVIENSEKLLVFEYNSKKGDYELQTYSFDGRTVIEGNVSSSKNETIVTIDRICYEDSYFGDDEIYSDCTISIKKGTDIKDIKTSSKELYMNEMDESDIESLMENPEIFEYGIYDDYYDDYEYDDYDNEFDDDFDFLY